ncbi:flagellar export protein FliJ [Pullulanibacillus sp. KACC 23026]|uniref:flagellar export protein FliJ n=1 Tax=Pullulanibacillus sp. KACC 23026 TaxID=3028315 RepID=UPI0023AE7856|nr:flagellar export protein FliJ [Pullulanibacillus sp. KACC 23026]WEG11233.1 flagellar export protein FliJ [Pullulanibacillus sp. KACC 23026]
MTYHFTFQKVLDLKENEKEAAKQELGHVKRKQLELGEQLAEVDVHIEEALHQYNQVDRKTVMELLEIQEGIDYFNRQMNQLKTESKKLDHEVEEKQLVLIGKTQEAKTWNQWKEKSKAAFIKQMEQKEQAVLDEMAVLRYTRRT